jgi:hypothetical protein
MNFGLKEGIFRTDVTCHQAIIRQESDIVGLLEPREVKESKSG